MFACLLAFKGVALGDLRLKRTLEAMGAGGLQERRMEETQDTEAGEGAGGLGRGSGPSALLEIPEGETAAFRVAVQLRSKAVGDSPHQVCHLPSAHLRAAGGGEGGPSPGLCSGRLLSDAQGGMGVHGTGLGDWFPNAPVPEDHPLRLCENRRAPRSPGAVAVERTAGGSGAGPLQHSAGFPPSSHSDTLFSLLCIYKIF